MASFECIGYINNISYRQNNVFLTLDEFVKGHRKSDGTQVRDRYNTYNIIFKPYFKKYLSEHFAQGMLVKVKGEVYPYAIEHGVDVNGWSILGETCNVYSYPRANAKQELRMIKESQDASDEKPDIDTFNQPDF